MNTAQQAHYGTMAMEFYQEEYGKARQELRHMHQDLNNLDNSRNDFVQALSMLVSLWEHDKWERTNPALLDVISHAKKLLHDRPAEKVVSIV